MSTATGIRALSFSAQIHPSGRPGMPNAGQTTLLRTVNALANAVDARDRYTLSHSREVAEMCVAMGHALGFSDARIELLRVAALLHDVGKIGVQDDILGKRGGLSERELVLVREHPVLGERIMAPAVDAHVLPWVRGHHERWDGTGYPDGLAGESIPLEARIIAICDSFNAMTSDRPYRESRPRVLALAAISSGAGSQFDPHLVSVFERVAETFDFTSLEFEHARAGYYLAG